MSPKLKREAPTTTYQIDAKESQYLYIKDSQILGAGKGLFTAIDIFKDEVISIFKGKILTNSEAKQRALKGEDGYFVQMLDGSIMDSKEVKCFAKYANDADGKKKSKFKCNSIISLDDRSRVCIVAVRNIKANEEIFCSYGKAYWKEKV